MSGSSLDGLDVAWCSFSKDHHQHWSGEILYSETFSFPQNLGHSLRNLRKATALELAETDAAFASFSGQCAGTLIQKVGRSPIAVASHGHTIFHQPNRGFTTQIGNGGLLASVSGLPVVSDFRTTDVGAGGQGAPLVPGAERFLFSQYDACLNLGGIANISFPKSSPFIGFDVCPCNQLLNLVAERLGKPYDANGDFAATGIEIPSLTEKLNLVPYYQRTAPKSLGNEDVARQWLPLLAPEFKAEDTLYTLCLHVARQIGLAANATYPSGKMLVTGGGAFNRFLVNVLRKELGPLWTVVVPDARLVSYKEAICFAFLGMKRWLGEVNCFAEITGARKDTCCGAIYLP